VIEDTALSGVI